MVINKKKNMGTSESKNEAEEPKFPSISNTASIITKHPQRGAKERQREKTAGKVLRHIERVVGSGKSINVQSMIKTLKVATEVALGVVEKLELEGKLVPKDEKGVRVYVVPRKARLNDLGENENEEIENELNEEEGENPQEEKEREGPAPRPKKERKSSVLDEIPDLDLTEGVQTRKRKRGNLKIIEQAEEFDEDDREEERSRGRGRPKGSVKRIRGKSERLQERKNSHSKKSPPSSPSDSASDLSSHTSSLITQSKIDDYFLSSHHLERGFNANDTLPLNGWRVGVPQYRLMALAIQQRVSGCEAYHTQDQHNTFIPSTPSITPLNLKGSSKKSSHKSKSHARKIEDDTAKSPSIESIEDPMSVDDGEGVANERHTARNSHTRNPKKKRNNRFRLTKKQARRSSRLTEGTDSPSEKKSRGNLSSVESDDGKNNNNNNSSSNSSNKSKRKKVETEGRILRSRENTPTKKDKESKETQETSEEEDETDEEDEEEEEEIELVEVSSDSDDENEGSMNSDNDNEDIDSNNERGYKSDRGDRDRENRRNSGSESPVTRGRSRSNSGGSSTKPNMTHTSTSKTSKDDHEGMLLRITPARKTQTLSTPTSSPHSHDNSRTRSKSPLRNVLNNLTPPLRDSILARLNPKPKNDTDASRNLRSSSLSTSSTSKPVLKPTLIRLAKPSTKKTTATTIPRLRPRNITQSKAG